MNLHYRQLFNIKHTLFIWMALCFIFCSFSLKASNSGGNDTLASSAKTDISINKQKLLIRNMTAEELTAFIDETFDMDSIPVDIINEINWAVARLEKQENSFENIVSETPSPTPNIVKTEEITKAQSLEVTKVKEIIPLKMLQSNTVTLKLDDRTRSIAKAELKTPEIIIPIPKKENVQFLSVAKLTVTEKANETPHIKELIKETEFIKVPEKSVILTIPVAKLTVPEKINELPVSKELAKKREFNQMSFLNSNPVLLAMDNATGSIPNIPLKAFDRIVIAPKFIVQPITVTKLQAAELKNEIPTIHNIVKIREAVNLKTFEMKSIALVTDNMGNTISVDELKTIEAILEKKPTPLTLLKKNLANNTTNNNSSPAAGTEFSDYKMSGPVNDLNAPVPSPDYYVSWEINKLFPEKDMLKMKSDTSITLILLSKEHRHYFHPFDGPITSGFGWRDSAQHNGIDIDLNKGDKVSAAFDGMVRVARRYGGFGNVVIIRHYNGLETVYAHLSKIKVKPGQVISSGDLVGLGGSTGHSTGSHLHFEIRFKGVPINPKYLISLSQQKLMCDEFTLKKTKWGLAVYPKNTKMYTVEKGDTVFEIAKRFGTTTASIKELNHLGGGRVRLKAGQQINVAH